MASAVYFDRSSSSVYACNGSATHKQRTRPVQFTHLQQLCARQDGVAGVHERRIEYARKPQREHDGGGVTGQKHPNSLQYANSERKPQGLLVVAFKHAATYRKRNVAHAQLRRKRLDVVLAVTLNIRQVLESRRQRGAGGATQRAERRTLVMAMTVANMVTKQVMNVIAGLHCKSQVQVTTSALIGAGSRLAPQTEAAVPSESHGRRQS